MWDLPRVLRLPGFIHRKGAPFLSRIVAINDIEPYKWTTLLETFPPVVEEKEKPRRSKQHLPPHVGDHSDDGVPRAIGIEWTCSKPPADRIASRPRASRHRVVDDRDRRGVGVVRR